MVQGKETVYVSNSSYKAVINSEIGGKGTRTFILDVRSSGTATTEVKLRRQWEPESAVIDRFTMVIKAR